MATLLAWLAGIAGAIVGAVWASNGLGGGIVGALSGAIVGGIIGAILDAIGDASSERKARDKEVADEERRATDASRQTGEIASAIERARAKRSAAINALVEAGKLDVDRARRVISDGWPMKLLAHFENEFLSFDECACVFRSEFQQGLSPGAVTLMLGPPDREVKSEMKTKTKVTWTYYENAQSRKGVTFKGVFDDERLVDFTAAKGDLLTQMLDAARWKYFGKLAAHERGAVTRLYATLGGSLHARVADLLRGVGHDLTE